MKTRPPQSELDAFGRVDDLDTGDGWPVGTLLPDLGRGFDDLTEPFRGRECGRDLRDGRGAAGGTAGAFGPARVR
ncbi:hypothetical protein GCM10009642_49850 [Nocardiopsis metallicus]